MIKFKSLLIGSGDCFLVENGGLNYLVDSGKSVSTILRLVPAKINIAICTHNDSDHTNGFLGILDSNDHSIDEIWLPGIWATVIDFIKRKGAEAFFVDEKMAELTEDGISDVSLTELLEEDDDRSADEFTDELGFISDVGEYFARWLPYNVRFDAAPSVLRDVVFAIHRIMDIAEKAYEKGVAIRWFFPCDKPTDSPGDLHNFKPLNCSNFIKMKKVRGDDDLNFLKLVYLTTANIHSLVFEYHIESKPRILFTADSLIKVEDPYEEQILVTAPHHGSGDNRLVYSQVKGDELIWVRSDSFSRSRPCDDFLSMSKKYCLRCTKVHPSHEHEIEFHFRDNNWQHIAGKECNCK